MVLEILEKKILNLGIFFQNFELKFPKSEANFDAGRGILAKNLQIMFKALLATTAAGKRKQAGTCQATTVK